MVKKRHTHYWKAVDRHERHLNPAMGRNALKQRLLGALLIIFMFTLQYIFMVLHLFKHLESIWKPALLYLIILTVWGVIRMGNYYL